MLRRGDTVRVAAADIDGFAACPVAESTQCGLPRSPLRSGSSRSTRRLIDVKVGDGQKEPLALTAVGGVLPAVTGFRSKPLATLGGQHLGGLERLLRLADGADGRRFGDGGDKPVPLVVPAQKLLLLAAVADQEEQMPVGGLNVKDRDLGVDPRLSGDLEVLAVAIFSDIERDHPRGRPETAGRPVETFSRAPIRANFVSKLLVSIVCLRAKEDTRSAAKVHDLRS